MMRTAVQACMSFDSMRRPVALSKRFWICVPPHCSLAGCQADGIKSGRSGDGPRNPGPEGDIAAEHLALVGDQDHVVLGQVLGEDRHLLLDLHHAGIGPPRGAGVLELLFATIWPPKRVAARRSASAKSWSRSCEP